jgi:hypothetical protein
LETSARSAPAGSGSVDRQPRSLPMWPLAITAGALILFLVAPRARDYPAAAAAFVVFGIVSFAVALWAPPRGGLLSPLGWAMFLFGVSLVVCPLLVAFYGPYRSVLRGLPPDRTINLAMVLMSGASVAFTVGYLVLSRHWRSTLAGARSGVRGWGPTPRWLIVVYLAVGTLGMVFAFRSLGGVIAYFTSPGLARQEALDPAQKAIGLAANILRPFLGLGMIMIWCRRIDSSVGPRRFRDSLVTAVLLGLSLVIYVTFSYNRASFAVPAVAILAVYSRRVIRIRAWGLMWLAAVGVVVLSAVGFYRSSGLTSAQLLSRQGLEAVGDTLDLNQQIQVYGNSPQFLGFLLLNSEHLTPQLGRTTISAALSPIPVFGKSFRPASGALTYNRWIYGSVVGDSFAGDQVVPFAGELWLDLRIAGILVGFVVIGALIAALQGRFERAATALEMYVTQFTAMWIAFLIIGSLEVVSQIFVYFFWPIYFLVGYRWLRRLPVDRSKRWTPSGESDLAVRGTR